MYRGQSQMNGWNIFARELQNLLRKYNLNVSQLDERVGINPEKVRRLSQSLHTPKSFPVLNVTEMELLRNTLNLPQADMMHLRAAILTTSIEKTLMDYIDQDDARHAANQLFPTILDALEEQYERSQDRLGGTRGDTGVQDDDDSDHVFASVNEALDEADRALGMSDVTSNPKRKKQFAQSAHDAYEDALQQLNQLSRDFKRLPAWKDLQQSAQQGKLAAYQQLADV